MTPDLPRGPWDDEPNRTAWIDPATGYPCITRRAPLDAWCGYVGVPPGHPAHGRCYHDVEVSVHGGLTYSDGCHGDPDTGICHRVGPGEDDNVWWFGFDCGHYLDLVPFTLLFEPNTKHLVYRDHDYVTHETTHLAAQLHRLATHGTEP